MRGVMGVEEVEVGAVAGVGVGKERSHDAHRLHAWYE